MPLSSSYTYTHTHTHTYPLAHSDLQTHNTHMPTDIRRNTYVRLNQVN